MTTAFLSKLISGEDSLTADPTATVVTRAESTELLLIQKKSRC